MTTSSVKAEPNNCGITKHIARTPGITKVGRGHNWRLAREMKDVFSRNIVSERLEVDTGDLPLCGLSNSASGL